VKSIDSAREAAGGLASAASADGDAVRESWQELRARQAFARFPARASDGKTSSLLWKRGLRGGLAWLRSEHRMIRWCSYCQTYLEEVEPLEDFSVTHSICASCEGKGYFDDREQIAAMREVSGFYRRLDLAATAGDLGSASALVDEGLALGLRIPDLAWGVLQPLLYRIGRKWEAGQLSVANEHLFTGLAAAAVELLITKVPGAGALRQHRTPDVLLVMAEGNYHTLGLRFVELAACLQGLKSQVVMPGLPAREIVALAKSLCPLAVGLSVALASQLPVVLEVAARLAEVPAERRPRLVVGGQALRAGLELPAAAAGVELLRDFSWSTKLGGEHVYLVR
jgi:methanogenic corrinoid protein MtbC1